MTQIPHPADGETTHPGPRLESAGAALATPPTGSESVPLADSTVPPERPGPSSAGPAPGPTAELAGLRLARGVLVSNRYLLTRRLHRDGVHEIWQAVDQTLVRDVRMIVLPASDDRAHAVMEAARRAAMVRDQHFLRVFDADRATAADLTRVWRPGEQDSMRVHPAGAGRGAAGGPAVEEIPGLAAPVVYVVEEWVPAQPLEQLLQRSPLPNRQAVVLALELAEALTAAHAQGMPHGFVGPDRVLVSSGGSVRISGLRSAAVLASRVPAPPDSAAAGEQDAADAAADVRSIGAVLYAALTARWPLGGDVEAPTESLWRWTPGAAADVVADAGRGDAGRRLRAAPRAHGRVLAPRQVRPGIPRRLDELVLRLLGHAVGDHPAVRTPAEAVDALARALAAGAERGAALPALRDLAGPVPSAPTPAVPDPGPRDLARPAPVAAPTRPVPTRPVPTQPAPTQPVPRQPAGAPAAAGATALAAPVAGTGATALTARTMVDRAGAANRDGAVNRDGAADSDRESTRTVVATRPRPAALAWQGAQSRVETGGAQPLPGEPVGRVPGDRRAPDLRLNPQNPPHHRWRPVLVLVVALALLGGAAALVVQAKKTLSGQGTDPAPLRGTTAPATPGRAGSSPAPGATVAGRPATRQIVLPISGAVDFDPVADGGNGSENPDEVGLATDGDPDTAWHTVTYFDRPTLGGLKPGVGLVVDLGSVRRVSAVVVGLVGTGTDLDLRTAAGGTRPDLIGGFTEVASATGAGTRVTLTPTAPVRARWLLLWLTSLPQIGADSYQGGISTITVRGPAAP